MKIKDYHGKTETEKWFLCHLLAGNDFSNQEPDIQILVNGIEIDVNEFVKTASTQIDKSIEKEIEIKTKTIKTKSKQRIIDILESIQWFVEDL